jgi:galactokinase
MQKFFSLKAYQLIGKSLTKVGKLFRDDLEITCPELDWLIKRALEVPSCIGASFVFNGDNVYAIVLGIKKDSPLYEAKLEDYERIFGFKAKAEELKPCGKCEIVES